MNWKQIKIEPVGNRHAVKGYVGFKDDPVLEEPVDEIRFGRVDVKIDGTMYLNCTGNDVSIDIKDKMGGTDDVVAVIDIGSRDLPSIPVTVEKV